MILSSALAVLAAIFFSLAMHSQKSALAFVDGLTGTFLSVATMAVMFWIVGAAHLKWSFWTSGGTLFFVIAGVMFPALGQRFQIASVRHVGPALTSAFGAFLPLFAALPAVVFLHERLSALQMVGIALLVAGLFLASVARGVSWRQRAFYVLLLPLGAAVVRAVAQPLVKAGYNQLAEPLFASMVMTSVSTLVLGLIVLARGSPRTVVTVTRGHGLFAINGLLVGMGILSMQHSLVMGSVSLTASLVSTTPIWTLLFGIALFRNERLQWWHGVVAILVCAGAVLVVSGHPAP